ncbi:hypothetical protein HU200_055236 [Digitaria exilis]|uniref:Uncharacterized protein n=1 Tax=Digitaria exilis TaxID=1010633 RepID=A0A835AHN7_9POAL|nr:hypothetical protein HU200_055236 [Digitaria exilis]
MKTATTSCSRAPSHPKLGAPWAWMYDCSVRSVWLVGRPARIPAKHHDCFVQLLCWMIWKHRNDVIFNEAAPSHARLWAACKEEARLWSQRLPPDDRQVSEAWCNAFSSM